MSDRKDYEIFRIPKRKKGEYRTIEAPSDALKQTQRESLQSLIKRLYESPFAHAFTSNKNIVTMAEPHVAKPYILCFDIKDFFPSIKRKAMDKEITVSLAFRRRLQSDRKMIDKNSSNTKDLILRHLDTHFCDFEDGKGSRLPQGAPGSPFLSNVFLHNFDWFAARKCRDQAITFSRYADDVVISGDNEDALWRMFYYCLQPYLNKRGLKINRRKTKMMSSKHRQMVCGLVVNVKINIPRKWRKRLRAEMYQQRDNKDLRKDTKGRNAFMTMVYDKTYEHITPSDQFMDIQKVLIAAKK